MRHLWTFFVAGVFCVAVVATVMSDTNAADENDPRIKKIDDPSISGLKTEVPLVKEMEEGLAARARELEEKERRVKEAEARLSLEEARIKEKIDELVKLQEALAKKELDHERIGKVILARMVKTFESMTPKKAAVVIAGMEDDLAVEVLLGMKEKRVGGILDVMNPDRAMVLSTILAKRRPASMADGGGQARP